MKAKATGCVVLVLSAGNAAFSECVIPPSDLLSWWPGDGDAQDLQGFNHGTLVNGASFAPGFVDQAFRLIGSSDQYVSFGDPPELQFSGDFTIAMWIKFDGPIGPRGTHLLGRRAPSCGVGGGSVLLARGDQSLAFTTGAASWGESGFGADSSLVVPTGKWTFVAVAYHSATSAPTVDFFVNGAQQLGLSTGGPLGNPQNANVQLGQENGCPVEDAFTGLIDEVQVFGRALAPAELRAEYAAGSAGKCKSGTCCIANGSCEIAGNCQENVAPSECQMLGGRFLGPDVPCAAACVNGTCIPTVSTWGATILGILLVSGGTLVCGRRTVHQVGQLPRCRYRSEHRAQAR